MSLHGHQTVHHEVALVRWPTLEAPCALGNWLQTALLVQMSFGRRCNAGLDLKGQRQNMVQKCDTHIPVPNLQECSDFPQCFFASIAILKCLKWIIGIVTPLIFALGSLYIYQDLKGTMPPIVGIVLP